MMKRLFFVVLILIGCGKGTGPERLGGNGQWCSTATPGQTLTMDKYRSLITDIKLDFGPQVSLPAYDAYVAAVHREATAALFQIFSNFDSDSSHVWYSSFNAPGGFGANDDAWLGRPSNNRSLTLLLV